MDVKVFGFSKVFSLKEPNIARLWCEKLIFVDMTLNMRLVLCGVNPSPNCHSYSVDFWFTTDMCCVIELLFC